jgi:sn-glycerol 3-phosphate transport system permease protein
MNQHRAAVLGWLLITPTAILLLAFTHWPIAATVVHSLFTTSTAIRPSRFIGLENYTALTADPVFLRAAANNAIFAFGTVVPSVILSLSMAVWVNNRPKGRSLLRLAYFTPTVLPMVAAANIWLFFYTPDIGLIDQLLSTVGIGGHNWLGNPSLVLSSIMVVSVWKEAGFFMIFYLAALQGIPGHLKEAARLEGAGGPQIFFRITFPLLTPTTLFVLINAVIDAFKRIDHLFILTKGGPNNASNLILYYIYETAFGFLDTAYAAAITALLLLVLAVLAIVKFRLFESRVHYQ